MENFYNRIRNLLPSINEIKNAIAHFSKRVYFIFFALVVVLCGSTLLILGKINQSFMVNIPMSGGSIQEGIVGTPRFVNPVLANSSADLDLVSLIYSGLMRKNSDGTLSPDLAEKYEVSKDGLTYTFTLKNNAFFQNNTPVTADDIVFTINKIHDPVMKSPKNGNWDGVSVEKIDEKTIKFILKRPYASFLENTTLGIMPSSIWSSSLIELNSANTEPIGSGPYKIENLNKQSDGLISSYDLASFDKFVLGEPYIKKISLRFYPNEEELITAIKNGEVNQASSIGPANALKLKEKGYRIEFTTLPRIFGLFFNQNQNQIFIDKNIITAINLAVDKDRIVREVLGGYGIAIENPIPLNMISDPELNSPLKTSQEERTKKAEEILKKDGWEKGPDGFLQKTKTENKKKSTQYLEFSISTGNAEELANSAILIKENLEAIGMKINVKTFEIGNLNQSVIRPRKYDALLFGQIINHVSDLFAFWHSSQRKDPGLNVAMYTNAKVDKILEEAFITIDENARIKKYAQFAEEINKDKPAVFLYSPEFIYVVSKNIQGFSMANLTTPADRFVNSYLWYTQTDNVWKIFTK